MLKPFTAKIQTALADRTNEFKEQVLMPDGRYQKLNTKINEIFDQIGKNLPSGQERLLFDLDELTIERDVFAYQQMYRQGLLDGMVMNRVLRMVRRNCRE
jgi:hypothetical protein